MRCWREAGCRGSQAEEGREVNQHRPVRRCLDGGRTDSGWGPTYGAPGEKVPSSFTTCAILAAELSLPPSENQSPAMFKEHYICGLVFRSNSVFLSRGLSLESERRGSWKPAGDLSSVADAVAAEFGC